MEGKFVGEPVVDGVFFDGPEADFILQGHAPSVALFDTTSLLI